MDNLQTQIDNLKTLQLSYDQIAGAAEAYNVGKTQLAAAITSKGVETLPTESYPEMAEKVNAISQETYEINGGEMYAKQLFGVANNDIVPGYWNLYEVMTQLLSDGRLVNYGGILLAEYYKGYDSLALSGAGAGGAYVVSDIENGVFKMYTEDTTHTWSTEFDCKGNRWVAYCFADEYHDFQITDTNTSPRSIFIGRKVGVITSLVAGRCAQLVIPDGNELVDFIGNYTQSWDRHVVIKNISNHSQGYICYNASSEAYYFGVKQVSGGSLFGFNSNNSSIRSVIIDCEENITGVLIGFPASASLDNFTNLIVKAGGVINAALCGPQYYTGANLSITLICERITLLIPSTLYGGNVNRILFMYESNDKTKAVELTQNQSEIAINRIKDIELMDGWCKPLSIPYCNSLTEANMYAHILQRLKQDEPDCGDGVTITLGATNLAKLTSEGSQALLAELQGTYGYTFQ